MSFHGNLPRLMVNEFEEMYDTSRDISANTTGPSDIQIMHAPTPSKPPNAANKLDC